MLRALGSGTMKEVKLMPSIFVGRRWVFCDFFWLVCLCLLVGDGYLCVCVRVYVYICACSLRVSILTSVSFFVFYRLLVCVPLVSRVVLEERYIFIWVCDSG